MNQIKSMNYLAYSLFLLFALLFIPFWKAILTAGIFALAVEPIISSKKRKIIPNKLIISSVIATILILILPMLLGIYYICFEILEFSTSQNIYLIGQEEILKDMTKFYTKLGIPANQMTQNFATNIIVSVNEFIISFSKEFILNIPDIVLDLVVFTLMLYILLTYQHYLKNQILAWKIISLNNLNELILVLQASSTQCFISLFIIGLIQSSIVVLGSFIVGYEKPLLFFIITFVCSFIPIIGAAPIAFVLSMHQLMIGNVGSGIFLFFVACFTGIIDNVLISILIKNGIKIKIDASITLISILGAIIIFGLPGLLLGPILAATAAHYFHRGIKS